jgi:hypothetical protein
MVIQEKRKMNNFISKYKFYIRENIIKQIKKQIIVHKIEKRELFGEKND